jgi:flagellar hook-associated protein 2
MSVSSTSTTTASTGSDILRITGLASGLDVDAMVKKLMTAENVKVDEQKQKLQTIQWTQDTYRDTIGDLNTFSSTYFDVTKKDYYMLSDSSYSNYSTTNSASSVAAATMGANAAVGDYKV